MSKWKPCYHCGRYGSEWVDGRTVTAPDDVKVEEGEGWTCVLCIEKGRDQVAEKRHKQPTLA